MIKFYIITETLAYLQKLYREAQALKGLRGKTKMAKQLLTR